MSTPQPYAGRHYREIPRFLKFSTGCSQVQKNYCQKGDNHNKLSDNNSSQQQYGFSRRICPGVDLLPFEVSLPSLSGGAIHFFRSVVAREHKRSRTPRGCCHRSCRNLRVFAQPICIASCAFRRRFAFPRVAFCGLPTLRRRPLPRD